MLPEDQYGKLRSEDLYEQREGVGAPVRKRIPAILIIDFILLGIIAAMVALFLFFAFKANNSDLIYPNVHTLGINLGGMTKEEAAAAIASSGSDAYAGKTIRVHFVGYENANLTVTAEELGLALDPAALAEGPYRYGREGGFFQNALSYIRCLFSKTHIPADISYEADTKKLALKIAEAAAGINKDPVQPIFTSEGNKVTVTKGVSGVRCDEDALLNLIIAGFTGGSFDDIEYTPERVAPEEATFNRAYDLVHKDAQDSVYSPELLDFTEEKPGVSFDLEAANAAISEAAEGESVSVELYTIEPAVKKADLEGLLFRDILAESVTYLTAVPNRTSNIKIGVSRINGVIVQPGETFSFNSHAGPYIGALGYKPAVAYIDGAVVQDLGGGVCQISSALYYCSLYSNLEIVFRTCHLYEPSYIANGLDATVGDGAPDYKFKNNTDFPIKIIARVEDDSRLYVQFIGTNISGQYVEIECNTVEEYPFDTIYEVDEGLAPGGSYYIAYGHTGYLVETYRLVYDADGTLLLRSFEDESIYSKRDAVIAVAPKS